jgi:hypothetical protein
MSGFRNSSGTDTDNIFEPASAGMSSTQGTYVGTGGALTYCPLQYGTQASATSMRLSGGPDLNTQWAAKGSVGYLANPQTWNTWTFNVVDQTQYNSSVPLPNGGSFIIPCSSINGTDHQTGVVMITFYSNGTWQASCAATNRYNDADSWWNSYGGGYEQTLYNPGQGNFTTNFANLVQNPGTTASASGNWLKNPTAGAGANYILSASFSAVYDYTATASDISASQGVNYSEGLRGASGYNHTIQCNGGFCVDAAGNTYGAVSNWNMANQISICYEFNSQGGFNNALTSFEGPNGALTWLTYVVATVTLALSNGSGAMTGNFNMGILTSWEAYASGSGTAWPPTYSGNHTLDANPWAGVAVNAGSQGQWTWTAASPPSGGGGVGGCVELSMYLTEAMKASEARQGLMVDGIAFHPDRVEPQEITEVEYSQQVCYLLRTESDIEVVLSDSCPMPLRNGGYLKVPRMKGQEVLVDDDGDIRWEVVKDLELLGMRTVVNVKMSYQCYLAGKDPKRRVATHTPHPEYSAKHFAPAMLTFRPNLKAQE